MFFIVDFLLFLTVDGDCFSLAKVISRAVFALTANLRKAVT
jgi:hypothetical protein